MNCFIDQAIKDLEGRRDTMIDETPLTREAGQRRWNAVDAIEERIAELERMKLPEGGFIDIRKQGEEIAATQ